MDSKVDSKRTFRELGFPGWFPVHCAPNCATDCGRDNRAGLLSIARAKRLVLDAIDGIDWRLGELSPFKAVKER